MNEIEQLYDVFTKKSIDGEIGNMVVTTQNRIRRIISEIEARKAQDPEKAKAMIKNLEKVSVNMVTYSSQSDIDRIKDVYGMIAFVEQVAERIFKL